MDGGGGGGVSTYVTMWKNLPLMIAFAGMSMNIIDAASVAAAGGGAARAGTTGTTDWRIVRYVILLHVEGIATGRGAPDHATRGGIQPVAVAIARR